MSSIQLILGDCLEKMKDIHDGSIDLTITSPEYDKMRTYNGNNDEWGETTWKAIIKELYRITKNGGIVVWVVGDETRNFRESLTSFKQAIFFNESGFGLLDTMIYAKKNVTPTYTNMRRYVPSFE